MRLTVFGANGGTGRHLVDRALAAGHQVTAVVREPASLPVDHERLDVVRADVRDAAVIKAAVDQRDALLSALGPRSKGSTICSDGAASVLDAMRDTGVRRVEVVSAAPLAGPDANDTLPYRLVMKPLVSRLFGSGYEDLARMERVIRASGVEWTIFRPPRLTNKPGTGRYRTELDHTLRRGYQISRADLADAMLHFVSAPEALRATIAVAY
jgi:putative NADH-flavin reductase